MKPNTIAQCLCCHSFCAHLGSTRVSQWYRGVPQKPCDFLVPKVADFWWAQTMRLKKWAHEQGKICIHGFMSKTCLWKILAFLRAVLIRIPSRKQKQSSLSGMFCRIAFIPNHFLEKQKQKKGCTVTFECVTICWHLWQNVTKSVLLKKLKEIHTNNHKSEIVTFCECHKLSQIVTH